MSLGFSSEAWPFVVNVSYWHRRGIYSQGVAGPYRGNPKQSPELILPNLRGFGRAGVTSQGGWEAAVSP